MVEGSFRIRSSSSKRAGVGQLAQQLTPDIGLPDAGMPRLNRICNSRHLCFEHAISVALIETAMKPQEISDKNWLQENIRIHLKRFLQKETGTKPVIVTTIVEV